MKPYIVPVFLLALAACKENPAPPEAMPEVIVAKKPAGTTQREEIIAFAKQQLGIKYKYACSDPATGFDCSGFVYYVFSHFDIDVPRSSQGFATIGPALEPDEFRVGDVLVFSGYRDRESVGHVGIICEANGMDSKFIHASSGSEMAVIITSLSSEAYTARFIKCVNVIDR